MNTVQELVASDELAARPDHEIGSDGDQDHGDVGLPYDDSTEDPGRSGPARRLTLAATAFRRNGPGA